MPTQFRFNYPDTEFLKTGNCWHWLDEFTFFVSVADFTLFKDQDKITTPV